MKLGIRRGRALSLREPMSLRALRAHHPGGKQGREEGTIQDDRTTAAAAEYTAIHRYRRDDPPLA